MSVFTKLEKGQFIIYTPEPRIITFQFNPESLTRTKTLEDSTQEAKNDKEEPKQKPSKSDLVTNQFLGEKFSVKLFLDSGEYLIPSSYGINPILAALEELMEPIPSATNDTSNAYSYPPKKFPQVVFAWGENRLVPVTIEGVSIDEKKYNNLLVPISAEVTVDMKLLIPDINNNKKEMTDEMKYTYDWAKKERQKMSKKYFG